MSETYFIKLDGPELSFCSSHFIILPDGSCEPLHGHDFRVVAEIAGAIDEKGLVVDFYDLQQVLLGILAELNHRVLLPESSPEIFVSVDGDNCHVTCHERNWSFPVADCVVLPMVNTTTELLARHIAQQLASATFKWKSSRITRVRIAVEEAPNQWAGCEMEI